MLPATQSLNESLNALVGMGERDMIEKFLARLIAEIQGVGPSFHLLERDDPLPGGDFCHPSTGRAHPTGKLSLVLLRVREERLEIGAKPKHSR